jgi:hypothetical protein
MTVEEQMDWKKETEKRDMKCANRLKVLERLRARAMMTMMTEISSLIRVSAARSWSSQMIPRQQRLRV